MKRFNEKRAKSLIIPEEESWVFRNVEALSKICKGTGKGYYTVMVGDRIYVYCISLDENLIQTDQYIGWCEK